MRDLVAPINRGVVTRVNAEGVFVEVPELGIGMEIGPCDAIEPASLFEPGDRVLLGSVSGIYDDVIIFGVLYLPTSETIVGP